MVLAFDALMLEGLNATEIANSEYDNGYTGYAVSQKVESDEYCLTDNSMETNQVCSNSNYTPVAIF